RPAGILSFFEKRPRRCDRPLARLAVRRRGEGHERRREFTSLARTVPEQLAEQHCEGLGFECPPFKSLQKSLCHSTVPAMAHVPHDESMSCLTVLGVDYRRHRSEKLFWRARVDQSDELIAGEFVFHPVVEWIAKHDHRPVLPGTVRQLRQGG